MLTCLYVLSVAGLLFVLYHAAKFYFQSTWKKQFGAKKAELDREHDQAMQK